MAAYIELDSDPQVPPPFVFPGVTVRSYRLEADLFQLQALCDKFLNIGSLFDRGFEYRAIVPFVDLDFLTYPRMLYALPPYSNWGFATQQEMYFRFFVVKFILVDDFLLIPVPEIISFFPYIFVDNYWSAIAGREIIGFPKLLANFDWDTTPAGPYPIKAKTLAIDVFATNSQLLPLPAVEIRGAPATAQIPFESSFTLPADLVGMLDPFLEAMLALEQQFDPGFLRTAHLKQLRDPAVPTEACYQAIVEGRYAISNLQPVDVSAAEVVVYPHATLSIADNLGLVGTSPFTPLSQYGATCDMTYEQVTTIFVNS